MKSAGLSTHRVAAQVVRSECAVINVGSCGPNKVPTCDEKGMKRPGRPHGEMIEGSFGKRSWIPE